jgi:uncharacterized FlaG/YvyC family protein
LRDIGHQSDNQLSFISSEHAVSYVRDLESKSKDQTKEEPALETHIKKINKKISPKNKELIYVLQNMLSFNPYFRMTAFEYVVECQIFDSVRDK